MIPTPASSNQLGAATRALKCFATFPPMASPHHLTTTTTAPTTVPYSQRIKTSPECCRANMAVYNSKKAKLSAARKERIKLPSSYDGFPISEFLSHPSGVEAVLNTRALQSFQCLDTNTYRCFLPKLQLLNFEAAPVLDLRVTPTTEDCTVELLSCKFQGSEVVEYQNDYFSALMTNRMTWDTSGSEEYLEVDVKLNLTLEVYTVPFTLLPTSAVEAPGNLMIQALVDRLVPLLLDQLLQDYAKWATSSSRLMSDSLQG